MTATANRAGRRRARSKLTPTQRAEFEAMTRVDARKLATAAVRVSDAAALQGLRKASPAARRFVAGMVMHVFGVGGPEQCVFDDAVRAIGDRAVPWRVIDELHALGILRWEDGAHVLHRVFSSTGQEWARLVAPDGNALMDNYGCQVVEFTATAAGMIR